MIAALRNLQRDANAAAQTRGVQVYSPTRVLPGGRANSGTAGRVTNRQGPQRTQQRAPDFGGGGMGPPATPLRPLPVWQSPTGSTGVPGQTQPMTTLDDMVRRAAGLGAAQPAPEQGGFLGTVVNSLPGKAIMGGLELLDRPRRVVISSLQEAVDAVNGGDASFNDWATQMNDPSFGFGDVIGDTGSKWGNRILGFVGDVLLDPLTYVAGSSVISGSGRRLRTDLAARMVNAGIEESIAQRVAKVGFQSLDNDTRALVRSAGVTGAESLLDRGYYFSIPWGGHHRIPLSGKVDEFIGGIFSGTRANLADTRFGTWMRHARTETGIRDAVDRMVTGGGKMSFAEAAERVNFRRTYSQVSRSASHQQATLAQSYIKTHGINALNQSMAAPKGGAARDYFKAVRTLLTTKYHLRIPELEDYLPRVYTDGGLDWILNSPQAEHLRSVLYKEIDFNDPSPVLMHRMFEPREEPYMIGAKKTIKRQADGTDVVEWTGGVPLQIKTGTPQELNEQFAKLVPDAKFKLVDDNFSSLASRYAKSIESDVGVAGGINALVNSKSGLVRRLDDSSVVELITDGDLVRHFNDEKVAQLRAQLQAAEGSVTKIRDDTLKGVSGIQGTFGIEMRGALEELRTVEPAKYQRMQELLVQIEALEKQRGVAGTVPTTLTGDRGIAEGGIWEVGASGDVTRGVGAEGPTGELMAAFDNEIDMLDEKFYALQERLAEVQPDAAREAAELESMLNAATTAKVAELAPAKTAAYEEFQRLAAEAAQVIEDRDTLATLRSRVLSNSMAADYIDSWVSDNAFQNLALAVQENPLAMLDFGPDEADLALRMAAPPGSRITWEVDPVTGQRVPVTAQVRAGVVPVNNRSYTAALQHSQNKRTQLLAVALQAESDVPRGLTGNQELDKLIGRTNAQIDVVVAARRNVEEHARIFNAGIRARREDVAAVRRVEAGLKARKADVRGYPERFHEAIEIETQLGQLRRKGGPIDQANSAYDAARAPLKEASQKLEHEQRMLRNLQRQQEEIARTELVKRLGSNKLRTPRTPVDQYPMTFADERALRGDLVKMERTRAKMRRDGSDGAAARQAFDDNEKAIKGIDDYLHRETVDPRSPFFIDPDGNVQLKRTNAAQAKLVDQRDEVVNNLLPRATQELSDARSAKFAAQRRMTEKEWAAKAKGFDVNIRKATDNVAKVEKQIARFNERIAASGGLQTHADIATVVRKYGGPKNRTWRTGTLKRLNDAVARKGELIAQREGLQTSMDAATAGARDIDESIASATRQLADQDQVRRPRHQRGVQADAAGPLQQPHDGGEDRRAEGVGPRAPRG